MEKEKDTQNELTYLPPDNGGTYGISFGEVKKRKSLLWLIPVGLIIGLIIWISL